MADNLKGRITPAEYLQVLFDVCRIPAEKRNAFLSHELGRDIKGLDELTWPETSRFIDYFKELKRERQQTRRSA